MVAISTVRYGNFGGVDFSVDPSLVDKNRSPWAPNMIADIGGMPEKRLGWRTLYQVEAPVNGIFYGKFGEEQQLLIHGGSKLYRVLPEPGPEDPGDEQEPIEPEEPQEPDDPEYPEEPQEPELLEVLCEDINSAKSVAVHLAGKLWILTGGEYLCYDGKSVKPASEDAYVPTTSIARPPAGGGLFFESINLLSPWRKNEFIPDGTTKIYQLDETNLDADKLKCTVRDVEKVEGTDFTVNRTTGQVTFTTVPAKPLSGQEGEVIISYAKRIEGYEEKVTSCSIMGTYGKGSSDRVVIAGNPEFPNQDWISGYNDPSYIPDLSYSVVGGTATAILGYASIGEYQAIIKESSVQDATVFLRSSQMSEEGEVIFPLKQALSGVGAVARGCIGYLNDEPVFLASGGVYAVTPNVITGERTVQNRSYYLDQRLTNEDNLTEAMAVNWRGYYIISVNSRCYVLDGRNRSYRNRTTTEFVYEGYHWENIPARCWCNVRYENNEDLYFGTEDGRVCRFNSDITRMHRYNDDGEPIYASWSSPADDDGDPTREKTLLKRGTAVTIRPYARSSARVYFRTEKDAMERLVRYETMDIFDWEDIDFERFTFNANEGPQEVMLRNKVKRYKRLQIIVANNALNEGFGVYGITKHFVVGNYASR